MLPLPLQTPVAQKQRNLVEQFLLYVLTGGTAFVADFAILYALTSHAGMHYLLSATIGFGVGIAITYTVSVRWIFHFRSISDRRREFAVFSLIGVAGLLLNNALLYSLTEWGGLHYLASKLIAAAAILVFNFGLRRGMLFSDRPKTRTEPPSNQFRARFDE